MATAAINQPEPYRVVAKIRHFPEAASQTFKKGDLLILATASDKGNQVKISGADPTAGIVGFAAENASGTENTDITVWSTEDNEFIANIEGTTALDADMTGQLYGVVATTAAFRVDTSDTTNTVVRVTQLVDAVGTVSGRVAFVFVDKTATLSRYRG